MEVIVVLGEVGADVSLVGVLGFGAVEEDVGDVGVLAEEGAEVVGGDGVFDDVGIEAAGACAGVEDIPEGDVVVAQGLASGGVGEFGGGVQVCAEDFPEGVARVRIVLYSLKRGLAGDAAEDEQAGICLGDGSEAMDGGHGVF